MVATGCMWNRISNTFSTCKCMLPLNCTDTSNEDVIISALEWELVRSLHSVAQQLRLSEPMVIEVLCAYELHRNATHGVHICCKMLFSPSGRNGDELSLRSIMGACLASTSVTSGHGIILMQFENLSSLLDLNIWTGIVGNVGMGLCCQADCCVVPWSSGKCLP